MANRERRLLMMTRRNASFVAVLLALVLFVAVACGASSATTGTQQVKSGRSSAFAAIKSPVCTSAELRVVHPGTHRTSIRSRTAPAVVANTRKTAVKMQLNTLLVVKIEHRDLGHLATSTGCWVRQESYIKHGLMTVVFLMNHRGYPRLVSAQKEPGSADQTGRVTILHIY
jgi:hypothetical protein